MGKHDGCKMPTPSQAHCSVCHRTFSGVWGFDKHRRNGVCLDPAELGMVEAGQVWRSPPRASRPEHWSKAPESDVDAG